jgi:phosphoribosylformylglycinamidine (FGAM) synthase PurS component
MRAMPAFHSIFQAARDQVERIAREVLTNPVIEEYTSRIEE